MPNKEPSEENILRDALGPGADCLRMEQLEMFAAALSTPPPALAKHVASCPYCQTEIHLLREFQAASPRAGEADAVQLITARLKARSGEIFPARQVQPEVSESGWKAFWRQPWLSPAMLAVAGVAMVAVLTVQLRHAPPGLHPPDPNHETLRSGAVRVLSPSGDVHSLPDEIRWEAAAGAAQYQIRLLEVDGTELWKTDTAANSISIPPAVRQRIVPLKTLTLDITALDGSGSRLAQSGAVRFRLLQKVYTP